MRRHALPEVNFVGQYMASFLPQLSAHRAYLTQPLLTAALPTVGNCGQDFNMLAHTISSRLASTGPHRAVSPLPSPSTAVCRPVVMRARSGDHSEGMGQDKWEQQPHESAFSDPKSQQGNAVFDLEGATPKASDSMLQDSWEPATDKGPHGAQLQEVTWKEQGVKQGKMEPSPEQAHDQPLGTENRQAADSARSECSSDSGADTGESQEMGAQGSEQPQGGRFDEEPIPGDHPYDPRPRERGHGVPPHKDVSNTGPGDKSA